MGVIRSGGWLAVAAMLVASGCTRAALHTEVHADGSWTRTGRFLACNETELQDTFFLPSGDGWMAARAEEKGTITHTARRTSRAGETLRQDLVVKRDAAGVIGQQLSSEVTIGKDGARRWQYREVLRWHGPRPKPFLDREPELRRLLREGLPDGLASEEDLQSLARHTLRQGWRVLVGPGEGWQTGAVHEEFAERHARMRLGVAIDRLLVGKFGRRLAPEERRGVVRKLAAAVPLMAGEAGREMNDWFDENGAAGIPMMFTARMPGKRVRTNGELDPVTGEVLWALCAAAPALEEVVLTATSEEEPGGPLPVNREEVSARGKRGRRR